MQLDRSICRLATKRPFYIFALTLRLQIHKKKRDETLTLITIYNFELAKESEEWFKIKTKKSLFMTAIFLNFLVVHVFSRLS